MPAAAVRGEDADAEEEEEEEEEGGRCTVSGDIDGPGGVDEFPLMSGVSSPSWSVSHSSSMAVTLDEMSVQGVFAPAGGGNVRDAKGGVNKLVIKSKKLPTEGERLSEVRLGQESGGRFHTYRYVIIETEDTACALGRARLPCI